MFVGPLSDMERHPDPQPDGALPHLLPEYRSDSHYLELPPGFRAEKRGSPLLEDVLQADFPVLTDVPRQRTASLFPYIGRGDDAVNRAVDSHFCPKNSRFRAPRCFSDATHLDRLPDTRCGQSAREMGKSWPSCREPCG